MEEDWIDPYFPPTQSSIIDPLMEKAPNRKEWKKFTWKRPRDHWGKGKYVLYNKIENTDIKQGKLGDCYFLSCLSAIAEKPERIKRIFNT